MSGCAAFDRRTIRTRTRAATERRYAAHIRRRELIKGMRRDIHGSLASNPGTDRARERLASAQMSNDFSIAIAENSETARRSGTVLGQSDWCTFTSALES